jgi:hypothetical protein
MTEPPTTALNAEAVANQSGVEVSYVEHLVSLGILAPMGGGH